MGRPHETDVVVAGAGPVGLMTALMLAERGISVEVIDQEPRAGLHDYALVLHPQALDLLDTVGLASELIGRGVRVSTVGLYDRTGRQAELRVDRLNVEFPFLLVLPQGVLDDVLERRLRQRDVRVQWDHRLAGIEAAERGVDLVIEKLGMDTGGYAVQTSFYVVEKTLRTRASFVVGADGFHSLVRRRLGVELVATGDALTYAAVECTPEGDLEAEGRVVLGEQSTDALWPLPGGLSRWSVELSPGQGAEDKEHLRVQVGHRSYPYVAEERVDAMIRERAPWFRGRLAGAGRSMSVRFERARAASFGQGRAWLVGDAGHVTGPVGGHSVNVGLREAHDLGSRIARILRGGGPHELLGVYDAERRAEWQRLLGESAALVPTDGASPWVREHASKLLPCLPGSGATLEPLAAQLGLALATKGP